MPGRKTADGTYIDIVRPLNNETRQILDKAVVEYERLTGEPVTGRNLKDG